MSKGLCFYATVLFIVGLSPSLANSCDQFSDMGDGSNSAMLISQVQQVADEEDFASANIEVSRQELEVSDAEAASAAAAVQQEANIGDPNAATSLAVEQEANIGSTASSGIVVSEDVCLMLACAE